MSLMNKIVQQVVSVRDSMNETYKVPYMYTGTREYLYSITDLTREILGILNIPVTKEAVITKEGINNLFQYVLQNKEEIIEKSSILSILLIPSTVDEMENFIQNLLETVRLYHGTSPELLNNELFKSLEKTSQENPFKLIDELNGNIRELLKPNIDLKDIETKKILGVNYRILLPKEPYTIIVSNKAFGLDKSQDLILTLMSFSENGRVKKIITYSKNSLSILITDFGNKNYGKLDGAQEFLDTPEVTQDILQQPLKSEVEYRERLQVMANLLKVNSDILDNQWVVLNNEDKSLCLDILKVMGGVPEDTGLLNLSEFLPKLNITLDENIANTVGLSEQQITDMSQNETHILTMAYYNAHICNILYNRVKDYMLLCEFKYKPFELATALKNNYKTNYQTNWN